MSVVTEIRYVLNIYKYMFIYKYVLKSVYYGAYTSGLTLAVT